MINCRDPILLCVLAKQLPQKDGIQLTLHPRTIIIGQIIKLNYSFKPRMSGAIALRPSWDTTS